MTTMTTRSRALRLWRSADSDDDLGDDLGDGRDDRRSVNSTDDSIADGHDRAVDAVHLDDKMSRLEELSIRVNRLMRAVVQVNEKLGESKKAARQYKYELDDERIKVVSLTQLVEKHQNSIREKDAELVKLRSELEVTRATEERQSRSLAESRQTTDGLRVRMKHYGQQNRVQTERLEQFKFQLIESNANRKNLQRECESLRVQLSSETSGHAANVRAMVAQIRELSSALERVVDERESDQSVIRSKLIQLQAQLRQLKEFERHMRRRMNKVGGGDEKRVRRRIKYRSSRRQPRSAVTAAAASASASATASISTATTRTGDGRRRRRIIRERESGDLQTLQNVCTPRKSHRAFLDHTLFNSSVFEEMMVDVPSTYGTIPISPVRHSKHAHASLAPVMPSFPSLSSAHGDISIDDKVRQQQALISHQMSLNARKIDAFNRQLQNLQRFGKEVSRVMKHSDAEVDRTVPALLTRMSASPIASTHIDPHYRHTDAAGYSISLSPP